MRSIILLGPPGSGKGTQSNLLIKKYKLQNINIGDILRVYTKKNFLISVSLKRIMSKGKLIPDILIESILEKTFINFDSNINFIIDGFPRTLKQAVTLKSLMLKKKIDFIIFEFLLSENNIKERLSKRYICKKCNSIYSNILICPKDNNKLIRRLDDNSESINNRLNSYYKNCSLISNYYKNFLIKIDAEDNKKKIFCKIKSTLNDFFY